MVTRRQFLQLASLLAMSATPAAGWATGPRSQTMILVELRGGNDGVNTLLPPDRERYQRLRPRLSLAHDETLMLQDGMAMHSALAGLEDSWASRDLAWIQGVGYPDPNRSHFRGIDIWETASDADQYLDEGWLASLLANRPTAAVAIGTDRGPFASESVRSISLDNPAQFIQQAQRLSTLGSLIDDNPALAHIVATYRAIDDAAQSLVGTLSQAPPPQRAFAQDPWGQDLLSAYQLIASGLPVQAIKVSLGSFDTHANQASRHRRLLSQLGEGLATLRENLRAIDRWDDTLVLSYSEFGRRLQENASGGTDHGTAAPQLVMGGRVRGGLYGRYPSLQILDAREDLRFSVDFRDVYASVRRDWFGQSGRSMGFIVS